MKQEVLTGAPNFKRQQACSKSLILRAQKKAWPNSFQLRFFIMFCFRIVQQANELYYTCPLFQEQQKLIQFLERHIDKKAQPLNHLPIYPKSKQFFKQFKYYCDIFFISMYRSQSHEKINRISYQNISSRISRLQAASSLKKVMSGTITPHLSQSQTIPSMPASRLQLRVQKDGIFGLDISNHVGRVAKNTGIKKYNQRQIKDALNRNTFEILEEKTNRKDQQKANKQYDSYRYSRMSPVPENTQIQPSKNSVGSSSIKLYNYLPQNSSIGNTKTSNSTLVPGRVYFREELTSLM